MEEIDDLVIYNELLNDIFKLFFVKHTQFSKFKIDISGSINYDENKGKEYEHKICASSSFICLGPQLKEILKYLQQNISKKNTFFKQNFSKIEYEKLEKYEIHINEALHKLNFLTSLNSSKNFFSSVEDLSVILRHHYTIADKISSDDETSNTNDTSSIRRKSKLKKKSSLTKSEKTNLNEKKFRKRVSEKNCVISILLSDFTTIAEYGFAFINFDDIRNMKYLSKVDNVELVHTIALINKIKFFTKKIQSILKTSEHIETENLKINSVVERIWNVAVIGFEVSSVINIIEQFLDAVNIQELQCNNKDLFKKSIENSNLYLEQYAPLNQKLSVIVDLITNLDLECEICENILDLIERRSSFLNVNSFERIGYFAFLHSITESMRAYKAIFPNDKANTLQNFLKNSFSYDAYVIQAELKEILMFNEIYQINNISTLKLNEIDIKYLESYFENLPSCINYFARMNNFLNTFISLKKLSGSNLEDHINELLKMTPRALIANMIFKSDVSFLELEQKSISLNLNLVYTMVELILPDFIKKGDTGEIEKFQLSGSVYSCIMEYIMLRSAFLGKLVVEIFNEINFENLSNDSLHINLKFLRKMQKMDIVCSLSILQKKSQLASALLLDYINDEDISSVNDLFLKYMVYKGLREKNNSNFNFCLNAILKQLVFTDVKYMSLLKMMNSSEQRFNLLMENYEKINDYILLEEIINSIVFDRNVKILSDDKIVKIKEISFEVEVYLKISKILELNCWRDAYNFGKSHPAKLFEILICHYEFDLLKRWAKMNGLYSVVKNKKFEQIDLKNLITPGDEILKNLLHIIERLPIDRVTMLLEINCDKVDNIGYFFNIIKCLVESSEANFENYKISLKIAGIFQNYNLQMNKNLLSKPLLLLEVLIMNSKFQLLHEVLNEIDNVVSRHPCKYCDGKVRNKKYSMPQNSSKYEKADIDSKPNSEFILFYFNLYKDDHILSVSCIDLLLRMYASKALDFQISNKFKIFYKNISISTDGISIDSLASAFKMPKAPPQKHEWIKDEDANVCQSCRYTVFTMLIRRHHCRRCGRVVCYSCSKHRIKIPEIYQDVLVRICIDCAKEIQVMEDKIKNKQNMVENREKYENCENLLEWELNGSIAHDDMLRQQFCYEHACDVALCLTILSFHKNQKKCIDLLLYHCKKLEMLLTFRNPEANFNSIAKILSCLSLAAKIRGGPSECDAIREHADIIKSFAKNGCENLMIPDSFNKNNIKKLTYNLVDAEKYYLALDISLKRGVSMSKVLAAHGLSYLKSGCFNLAREKFLHCMTNICSFAEGALIFEIVMSSSTLSNLNIKMYRRPKKSPPLLGEIIRVIESISNNMLLSENDKKTSSLYGSATSISTQQSSLSKQNSNTNVNENAFIILNTLSSLKALSNGGNIEDCDKGILNVKSKIFNECFYYLITYGSHSNIINFLIRYNEIKAALRYFILQNFKYEYFISHIFLHFLKIGEVANLIDHMLSLEEHLLIWKNIFVCICRYLESKGLLNSLYQLQVLLKDSVRASMTCVMFFLKNSFTFKQLNEKLFYLDKAQKHLEDEIELCQNWENVNFDKVVNKTIDNSFSIQLDYKSLNTHLNTVLLQKEVTKFLAKFEEEHLNTLNRLLRPQNTSRTLPTLFGSVDEKIEIAAWILLCGQNLEGFGLSFRIIQEFKLIPTKIYKIVTQFLAKNDRLDEILKLYDCIIGSNDETASVREADEMIFEAIKSYTNVPDITNKYKLLSKRIKNIETQVACYIFLGQLETAYLIAEQHNQLDQVHKVLVKAKEMKRQDIKNLCEKKLKMKLRM
ncbi:zinc finger FYVE domain-containing protein 26 homolog isoform X2 [Condylostylus longicornis]|nr:zinc finger FYVE domain-containing protein 26 homolog isoform X2 [Condylostylus longicornis]